MSKRDAKRDADEEEDEEEEDDISSSGGDEDDSGNDEMSESASEHGEDKATGGGKAGGDKGDKAGNERSLRNQPFDEALDLSESEDNMSEVGKDSPKKTAKPLKNLPFDEALELSASAQDLESPVKQSAPQAVKSFDAADKSKATTGGKNAASAAASSASEVKNRPFDEEVDLSDSGESVDTNDPSSPDKQSMKGKQAAPAAAPASQASQQRQPPASASAAPKKDEPPRQEERKTTPPQSTQSAKPAPQAAATKQPEKKAPETKRKVDSESSEEESESGDDDDEDDDDDEEEDEVEEAPTQQKARPGGANAGGGGISAGGSNSSTANGAAHATMMASAGAYKESDFAHLKVSNDVKELFQYIGRFKPQEIELETRLKCFIPEYIPAVGDMDAFLKIPRPDGEQDNLGLKMLDEPSLQQSDATVLDLQLRSTSKKKHGDIVVRSIENAEKSPKEIDKWIKSIADLHRTKPPPQVHYTKSMPDIESLMQVWPDEFEELLGKTKLPGASMDMSLEQYIRVICAILDIPVYKNVYESLHVLFTLYLEFRSNQHFMNYDEQLDATANTQAPPPFTARREEVSFSDDYPSSRK